MKNVICGFLVMTIGISMLTGCAAVTAIRQPGRKNLAVLDSGTDRENVITYLGAPISTEQKEDKKIEVYEFVQGYSGGAKATRAVCHLVLDVFTFFIWEAVGWPAELIFNGDKNVVRVTYDMNNKVQDTVFLKR